VTLSSGDLHVLVAEVRESFRLNSAIFEALAR
jgi:hypothetical protein